MGEGVIYADGRAWVGGATLVARVGGLRIEHMSQWVKHGVMLFPAAWQRAARTVSLATILFIARSIFRSKPFHARAYSAYVSYASCLAGCQPEGGTYA